VQSFGTAIGEINLDVKMVEVKSTIGGEGNRGVVFAPIHIGRDALVAVALVLQLFAGERAVKPGITISAIKAALPQWRIGKPRIYLPGGCDITNVIEKWQQSIVKEYGEAVTLNELDGLRFDHRD
jgi:phosphomannomutase